MTPDSGGNHGAPKLEHVSKMYYISSRERYCRQTDLTSYHECPEEEEEERMNDADKVDGRLSRETELRKKIHSVLRRAPLGARA